MASGIYTITNIINGKIYVGYATSINGRLGTHKYNLSIGIHLNSHLQGAVNEYGIENFLFEELEQCSKEYLSSQEHYWATILNVHNPEFGYNLAPTHPYRKSSGKRKGFSVSDETRAKIKAARLASPYKMSDETKEKIRIARAKQVFTDETRLKLSLKSKGRQARLGHKASEETKKKQSESLHKTIAERGYWRTPEQLEKTRNANRDNNKRPFIVEDLNTGQTYNFDFLFEAVPLLGIKEGGVWAVLNRPNKITKNFILSYK